MVHLENQSYAISKDVMPNCQLPQYMVDNASDVNHMNNESLGSTIVYSIGLSGNECAPAKSINDSDWLPRDYKVSQSSQNQTINEGQSISSDLQMTAVSQGTRSEDVFPIESERYVFHSV